MTIDFAGFKTRRLTVIRKTDKREGRSIIWECYCRCGNTAYVSARSLSASLGREAQQTCGRCRDTEHELYSTWQGILSRCERPETAGYEYYGGRGISICARWRLDFLNFVEDMGPRPVGYSIERINVNGNYEPANCKWADAQEQAYNKQNLPRKLTEQDLVDIYHAPRSTPVQYIAEKFNISIKSVRNIWCIQHSRSKMLAALKTLTPRSIFK